MLAHLPRHFLRIAELEVVRQNSPHPIMKFETYKATPGLDRIPAADRFVTYRSTHRRLLQEDENYRKRHHQYIIAVVAVVVLTGSPAFTWFGSSVLSIAALILLSLIQAAVIIVLAFRHQHHMNECIGTALRQSADSVPNDRHA